MVNTATPLRSGVTTPLVTICVPTVGRVAYLPQTLKCIEDQTYPNIEVIILDNASPAAARDLLQHWAIRRSNAQVLRSDQRQAMFRNFNRGLEAAAGDYITFFHDDDLYDREFVQRYVEQLERFPTAGFAGGNYIQISSLGEPIQIRASINRTRLQPGREFIRSLMRSGRSPFSTPGIIFRRTAIGRAKFDEGLPIHYGDFVILMRLAEKWDVVLISDTLFSWRVHGENESRMAFSEAIPLRTTVLSNYCAEYAGRSTDVAFAATLRGLVKGGHTIGLLWGWLAGESEADRNGCRNLLTRASTSLTAVVAVLDRMLPIRSRRRLIAIARRIAAFSGL